MNINYLLRHIVIVIYLQWATLIWIHCSPFHKNKALQILSLVSIMLCIMFISRYFRTPFILHFTLGMNALFAFIYLDWVPKKCNNMLYPKEDVSNKRLLYACRNCGFSEPSKKSCVYVNNLIENYDELKPTLCICGLFFV